MRTGRVLMATVLAGLMVVGLGATTAVTAAPRQDLQQVAQQVRELQMNAEAAKERAQQAQAKLNGIQSDLAGINSRAARERADLNIAQATIGDIARNAYASGGIDPTLQVLMADNPSEFLAQAAVMGQLEQNQVDQMRRAQTIRLRVAQTQAEISDREASAQGARDEMAAAQSDAAAQLSAAQDVLASLQEEERQRLAQLAAEHRQQQIDEARAAAAAAAAQAAAQSTSGGSGGGGSNGGDSSGGSTSAESGGGFAGGTRAQVAIQYALAQVGDPYSYSANPPYSWDCSKLTAAAWAQAGVGLTAISYAQWDQTQHIPVSDIQPGDLVFYFGSGAHHVGMYIGGGKMVHAANPTDGVEITDFLGPWYGSRFSGVGRVIG